MRNRYAGKCTTCDGWTAEGGGDCVKVGSRWQITCDPCAQGVPIEERTLVKRTTEYAHRVAGETFRVRPHIGEFVEQAEAAGMAPEDVHEFAETQVENPEHHRYYTVLDASTRRANWHDVEDNEDYGDMSLRTGDPITTYTYRPATDAEIAEFLKADAAKAQRKEAERAAQRAQQTAVKALLSAPLGEEVEDRGYRTVAIEQRVQGYGDDIRVYADGTVARHHRNDGFDPDNWVRRIDLPNALELVIAARDYSDRKEITDEDIRNLIATRKDAA